MAEHFTEKTNDLAQLLAQQIEAFEKEEAALKVSSFFFFFLHINWVRIAQLVVCQTCDWKVTSTPAGAADEFSSSGVTFCSDFY